MIDNLNIPSEINLNIQNIPSQITVIPTPTVTVQCPTPPVMGASWDNPQWIGDKIPECCTTQYNVSMAYANMPAHQMQFVDTFPTYGGHTLSQIQSKAITQRTAKDLRAQGWNIPLHIKDELQLTLQTYLDTNGHLKVDVIIPQYTLNVVDLELFENRESK